MVNEIKKTDNIILNLWDIIEILSCEFKETRNILGKYNNNKEYCRYRGLLNPHQQRGTIKILLLIIEALECKEIAQIIDKEDSIGNRHL